MILSKKNILTSLLFLASLSPLQSSFELNLIGFVNDKGSGACHTTSFIECLHADVKINMYKTEPCSVKGFPDYFKNIVDAGVDLNKKLNLRYTKPTIRGMTIYTDLWDKPNGWKKYKAKANKSIVKYAYCVTESTLVPSEWVSRLNENFDAVLVPDQWLIDVYKNSGVILPVFTLPEVLDLNSLLATPLKKTPNKPFVFGFSGGFWPRKNHEMLMIAFAQEFGDNPDVRLKVHGRSGNHGVENVVNTFHALQAPNISLHQKKFPRDKYENFITSLDCYITISKGEGFSIIPREALAAGIPCILSDNTAQKTICRSGHVYAIPCNIIEPFTSFNKIKNNIGCDYNCTIDDVRKALRDVYQNYYQYLARAEQGREWVKQYLAQNLKPKYLTLVKPKTVVLGSHNEITDDYLMTNSKKLFQKYKVLGKSSAMKFLTVQ